ncbi:hypothetical protein WA577_006611 [Blastocystis sp. JDR]
MEVQRLIEKHVSPVVEYYEYVLPNTCPLKIENSRFYLENQFKERLEEGHYRCGKCGKVFVHEYYLLLHNERKHPELQSTSTVCLAKYRSVFDGVTGKKPNCYDVETKRSLIMCQKTMMLCFPTEDYAVQSDLYKYMYRSLCAPLLCQTTVEERTEEYTPVTVTAVVFPVVIVIVAFAILFIVMYKKFSTPKEDLRIFSKFD